MKREQPDLVFEAWLEGFRQSGSALATVGSGSMLPTLKQKQRVVIHKEDPAALFPGDLVSFVRGNTLITHRVVQRSIDPQGQLTLREKGDSTLKHRQLDLESVVGKAVISKEHRLSRSINALIVLYYRFTSGSLFSVARAVPGVRGRRWAVNLMVERFLFFPFRLIARSAVKIKNFLISADLKKERN